MFVIPNHYGCWDHSSYNFHVSSQISVSVHKIPITLPPVVGDGRLGCVRVRVCVVRVCAKFQVSKFKHHREIPCTVVVGSNLHWAPCIVNNFRSSDRIHAIQVPKWPLGSTDHVDMLLVRLRPWGRKLFKKVQYSQARVKGHRNSSSTVTFTSRTSPSSSFKFLKPSASKLQSK